jgi:hypothetical protein
VDYVALLPELIERSGSISDAPASSMIARNALAFVGGVSINVPYTSNESSLNMRGFACQRIKRTDEDELSAIHPWS